MHGSPWWGPLNSIGENKWFQRPVIFYTNGHTTWMWDDTVYPPRRAAGFYKKDELSRLILRRTSRQTLDVAQVKDAIVERYYQKRAIGSIFSQFTSARRKALLVMATGTGKTRTAIALTDVLQRAGLGEARPLPDRPGIAGEPSVQRFQGAPAGVQPGKPRGREGH